MIDLSGDLSMFFIFSVFVSHFRLTSLIFARITLKLSQLLIQN